MPIMPSSEALPSKADVYLIPTPDTVLDKATRFVELYHKLENSYQRYYSRGNPRGLPEPGNDLYEFHHDGKHPPHVQEPTNVESLEIFDEFRLFIIQSIIQGDLPHGEVSSPTVAGMVDAFLHQQVPEPPYRQLYEESIVQRDDWYTDAVFAQQYFTGPNPTTIKEANLDWIGKFVRAAETQKNASATALLESEKNNHSLYIQDCSWFRESIGIDGGATIQHQGQFATATVSLFRLSQDGKLHPLAIIIDYKDRVENSVVIFNRRLDHSDTTHDQETDWPWRYAKTCAQISDWLLHEVAIHLVNTHFVEEVVIIATNRAFDQGHIIYRLLEPHWLKTLAINAAARSTLVPSVITQIVGLTADQLYKFVNHAYSTFDWTGLYIPNDLEARGFPTKEILDSPKFKNYPYGKNMLLMWSALQKFVESALAGTYTTDTQVENDPKIRLWCEEMRRQDGGNMPSFPRIRTIHDLVDAIVMAIHIASPQHSAVNYLQMFYQSFVPNKPPALRTEQPRSLEALLQITRKTSLTLCQS